MTADGARQLALALVLLAAVVWLSMALTSPPERSASPPAAEPGPVRPERAGPDRADPDCVVATWQGNRLRVADVDWLRAAAMPPLDGDAAVRWAADVALVSTAVAGAFDRSVTPRVHVQRYREWLMADQNRTGGAELTLHRRDALRRELGFAWDRCRP